MCVGNPGTLLITTLNQNFKFLRADTEKEKEQFSVVFQMTYLTEKVEKQEHM